MCGTDVPRKAWNAVLKRMECDNLWSTWNLSLDLKPYEIDLIYLERDACRGLRTANCSS